MHPFLQHAVFTLTDSIRDSALELDVTGDGEIDVSDHKSLLKLLHREFPELKLSINEVGALSSAFEGSTAGSLVIDHFLYSCEQHSLSILQAQSPSPQQLITSNTKKRSSEQRLGD